MTQKQLRLRPSKLKREEPEAIRIIKHGPSAWNKWRAEKQKRRVVFRGARLQGLNLRGAELVNTDLRGARLESCDLTGAYLSGAHLEGADLYRATLDDANLTRANLTDANLRQATLQSAILRKATLSGADLSNANVRGADLANADLSRARLNETDLRHARLTNCDLTEANLISTNLENADLTGCRIYGLSAWSLRLSGANQSSLIITPIGEPPVEVDDIAMAQFLYLLLRNENIRRIIDAITSKVVLILGRFTPERKAVLNLAREKLRERGFAPILFDVQKPSTRDITETVSTLAHLARFVIADITDAKSIPQELMAVVPHLPSVPIQPIINDPQLEYGMFEHFRRYPWVLPLFAYRDRSHFSEEFFLRVVDPAEHVVAAVR